MCSRLRITSSLSTLSRTSSAVSPSYSTMRMASGVALHEAQPLGLLDVVARQVQDGLVGELHGVGVGGENGFGHPQRVLEIVEVDDVQGGEFGLGYQAHLRFHHAGKGVPSDPTIRRERLNGWSLVNSSRL